MLLKQTKSTKETRSQKTMEIKVLGPGCNNCNKLAKAVTEVAQELGITVPVQKVTDIQQMLSYGIMSTPALVVDGKVKFAGRVPSKDEIKKYLQGASGDIGCSSCGCCS
jgi:small redox-active disulfide protein 2